MAAPWKPEPKNDYLQPPAGNHPAVLVAMVDLGTQVQEYQGQETRQRRAFCVWELVGETDGNYSDGRNFLVGIDLNLSNNENAKFRQWVEARLNKKYPKDYQHDFSQELGKACLLAVSLNAKGYPKVGGMSAVPRGMTVPAAKIRPFLWCLDEAPTDGTKPQFPDWMPRLYGELLTDVIARCVEFNSEEAADKPVVGADEVAADDGNIPF